MVPIWSFFICTWWHKDCPSMDPTMMFQVLKKCLCVHLLFSRFRSLSLLRVTSHQELKPSYSCCEGWVPWSVIRIFPWNLICFHRWMNILAFGFNEFHCLSSCHKSLMAPASGSSGTLNLISGIFVIITGEILQIQSFSCFFLLIYQTALIRWGCKPHKAQNICSLHFMYLIIKSKSSMVRSNSLAWQINEPSFV